MSSLPPKKFMLECAQVFFQDSSNNEICGTFCTDNGGSIRIPMCLSQGLLFLFVLQQCSASCCRSRAFFTWLCTPRPPDEPVYLPTRAVWRAALTLHPTGQGVGLPAISISMSYVGLCSLLKLVPPIHQWQKTWSALRRLEPYWSRVLNQQSLRNGCVLSVIDYWRSAMRGHSC